MPCGRSVASEPKRGCGPIFCITLSITPPPPPPPHTGTRLVGVRFPSDDLILSALKKNVVATAQQQQQQVNRSSVVVVEDVKPVDTSMVMKAGRAKRK